MNAIDVDPAAVSERIVRAGSRRLEAGLGQETDSYRLVHDHHDGLPGLRVDRLGRFALVKFRHRGWADEPRVESVVAGLRALGLEGARFVFDAPSKDRVPVDQALSASLGAALSARGFVAPAGAILGREAGLSYELSVSAGYSCGLFFDMRPVRSALRRRWEGRRTLNLFAYTCAFGVALVPGNEVVNVDVSAPYLAWGQRNYALNGLVPKKERFVRKDVFSYLEVAQKVGNRYDAVILDPPSYSAGKRGRSRRFSLKRDFDVLLMGALSVLSEGGELLVAINLEGVSRSRFRERVSAAASKAGRRVMSTYRPGVDFPEGSAESNMKAALIGGS